MWTIIAIALIILGPAALVTYFVVDGYQAWAQTKEARARKRMEREAEELRLKTERERAEQREAELRWELRKRMLEQEARNQAANAPKPVWCLGVARESSSGSKLPNLYYRLDDYDPKHTEEIMKAYEEAENAHKDVVVLPHIGITVRTKTAIRIRIRQVNLAPDEQATFVV